jgi:hypothetical protein
MPRCPACGAHRDASDDFCPVCGETLTTVHFSEATGEPWFERPGPMVLLVLLFWPAALYGLYRRGGGPHRPSTRSVLGGCLLMAFVWALLL